MLFKSHLKVPSSSFALYWFKHYILEVLLVPHKFSLLGFCLGKYCLRTETLSLRKSESPASKMLLL